MFRISGIDCCAVSIPLAAPIRMAGEEILSADNLVVRIDDGEGNFGWGEAASAPLMTGETAEGMVAAARFIAGRLDGMEVGEPAICTGPSRSRCTATTAPRRRSRSHCST